MKLYRLLLFALALIFAMNASANVPTGYYNSIDGKRGQDLKNAVHQLLKNHTVMTYSSLWYHFQSTDCHFENPNQVWDMYSNITRYYRGASAVSGMNREHSFPKSWWGGTQVDAYTDLNHLYPSDADANMAKNNYPLGEVSTASFNNGCTKVGTPKAGQGGGSSTVFEPDDEYKGDFARTYFYMATCYQDYTWKYTYMVSNTSWQTLNQWSINLLLKWSREDPVSDKEVARNEAVYKIQNNRNPYIDNPQLAEYIWGNHYGEAFYVDQSGEEPQGDPILITPNLETVIEMGEVAIGKSLSMTIFVKGQYLNEDLSVLLFRDDARMFSIPVNTIPRNVANSEQGYPLVITYRPTTLGNHKCRLLIYDGGLTGSYGADISAKCVEVPSLSTLTALPATDIDGENYTAHWRAAQETVDYYIVTRIVYDDNNNIVSSDEFTTDETSYQFDDLMPGQTHTYSVQSYRLGYTSNPSNVITVAYSAINGIEADKPIAFIPTQGGVLVKCSEPHRNVDIYNASGKLVKHIDVVNNDDFIYLPQGIYIMRSTQSRKPQKLVIK
ncbi:MAG: endonuclease [Muribaculaceae bacterium]|nr:endonuclease [Muribaculaceae bacterium]